MAIKTHEFEVRVSTVKAIYLFKVSAKNLAGKWELIDAQEGEHSLSISLKDKISYAKAFGVFKKGNTLNIFEKKSMLALALVVHHDEVGVVSDVMLKNCNNELLLYSKMNDAIQLEANIAPVSSKRPVPVEMAGK